MQLPHMDDHNPSGSAGPLTGVRVIEWGSLVSAPFCGKALGELGADVIKIEPPGTGEAGRYRGPFPDNVPHPEKSGLFLFANLNKRGITLDLVRTPAEEFWASCWRRPMFSSKTSPCPW